MAKLKPIATASAMRSMSAHDTSVHATRVVADGRARMGHPADGACDVRRLVTLLGLDYHRHRGAQ